MSGSNCTTLNVIEDANSLVTRDQTLQDCSSVDLRKAATLQCERGLTPNPDLLCNKAIKFDLLRKFASSLGAQILATGHYARLQQRDGNPPNCRPPCSFWLFTSATLQPLQACQ